MAFGWCLKYNCAARVHHATTLIATISWPRIQHHSATIHGYPSSRIVMDLPIVRRSPLEILYPRSIGRSCSDLPIDRYIDSMIDGNRITIELDRHGILATVRRFLNVQVRYNYALGRRRRTCFIFTVARTRIRRKFCTRTHEKARPNHQKEKKASIIVHLNAKIPSEPSERSTKRQSCTRTHERAGPNRETDTEASMIVHLKSKKPVRTIRKKHQASIVYTHARTRRSEP